MYIIQVQVLPSIRSCLFVFSLCCKTARFISELRSVNNCSVFLQFKFLHWQITKPLLPLQLYQDKGSDSSVPQILEGINVWIEHIKLPKILISEDLVLHMSVENPNLRQGAALPNYLKFCPSPLTIYKSAPCFSPLLLPNKSKMNILLRQFLRSDYPLCTGNLL